MHWPAWTAIRICMSFDVDFDPTRPRSRHPGPAVRPIEAQLCMEMIADTRRLAADVVELNPAFDVCNRTAKLAVDLIERCSARAPPVRRPLASTGRVACQPEPRAQRTSIVRAYRQPTPQIRPGMCSVKPGVHVP
jgi:hypothetical protein